MKYYLIALLLLFCSSVLAKEVADRLAWFNEAQWDLSTEIQSANNERLNELMVNLGELWLRRDGALGSEVAPFIIEVIVKEPSIVFTWFRQHPKHYASFVENLQYSVFTDYNGDSELVKELEQLRVNAISACKSIKITSSSPEIDSLAKALESQLVGISVREID